MGKRILPFTLNVEMVAYQNRAFWLGIAKANLYKYELWLCNKLTNSVFWENGILEPFEEDPWSLQEDMFEEQCIGFHPQLFTLEGIDLLTLNKSMIERGYYVLGNYNECYIPQKKAYRVCDFDHDYILFGYDDSTETFKSAGYTNSGKYEVFDITYRDYLLAVINNLAVKAEIKYYKINNTYEPAINLNHIREKTQHYLLCRWHESGQLSNDKFGLDSWLQLANYVATAGKELDVRLSKYYVEFHNVMLHRMQLVECYNVVVGDELSKRYENVVERAHLVHNLFMKYNLSPRDSMLSRIVKIISENRKAEEIVIRDFLDSLS